MRIQTHTLLKGSQADGGGDIGLDGANPERLPDRDVVRGRPPLRIPLGPDLSSQHPVVEEPDRQVETRPMSAGTQADRAALLRTCWVRLVRVYD
jgi:hypothetical protein